MLDYYLERYTVMNSELKQVEAYLQGLQQELIATLGALDTHDFVVDRWQKAPDEKLQGLGRTCILEDGSVFERGGVGFSDVRGDTLPATATARRPEMAGQGFRAMGVSLVVHPRNPYAPTAHMNVRFFCTVPKSPNDEAVWWFGGGFDLTPYYGFVEDCQHWHQTAQQACAAYGDTVYADYKKWCDEYFYLKHRAEPRGIGGLFFDDLNTGDFERDFGLMQSVGNAFLPAYMPIIQRRKTMSYSEAQRNWQCQRRGRYVEFNLVFDRGTLFGLQSGGRTESILMSMPPQVQWRYQVEPEQGSPEAELLVRYLVPQDWLSTI